MVPQNKGFTSDSKILEDPNQRNREGEFSDQQVSNDVNENDAEEISEDLENEEVEENEDLDKEDIEDAENN